MDNFFDGVALIIEQARAYVGRTANLAMCVSYFEVGRMIVEQEQGGKARAEYGCGLLKELSEYLSKRFGKGFSEANLKNFRQFYKIYSPSIQQTLSVEPKSIAEFASPQKGQAMSDEFKNDNKNQKRQALSPIRQSMISESNPFRLSWTHYLVLIRIKNEQERRFYEIEAINQQWTVRQLQRQYGSSLYERLALSRNKDEVMRLANEGQTLEKPNDLLKSPLVLEFQGKKRQHCPAYIAGKRQYLCF